MRSLLKLLVIGGAIGLLIVAAIGIGLKFGIIEVPGFSGVANWPQ